MVGLCLGVFLGLVKLALEFAYCGISVEEEVPELLHGVVGESDLGLCQELLSFKSAFKNGLSIVLLSLELLVLLF